MKKIKNSKIKKVEKKYNFTSLFYRLDDETKNKIRKIKLIEFNKVR